ncbi:Sugar transporter SWEET1 [Sarcoptes scabiei]|uniref:Sugar transporter SWEET1 n=1 Tax=Sarcoptes scabiei TaxID=52283 RepID=A0A834RAT6_SARSC|nr:Sugar transporter SWEET1 [Sarcoptes scabiei]
MISIELVGNVATILTIVSFLTGSTICRNIYRSGSTKDFTSLPFLMGTACSYLWLRYGFLLDDSTMIFINTIGLILQSFYLLWFYLFTTHKNRINRKLFLLAIFLTATHFHIRWSTSPDQLIGSLAALSSLFFCASPLPLVFESFRNKCTENLPFLLILSSFLVSFMWFIYGYLIDNAFVQIPNGLASIIAGVQLSLFLFFPSKRNLE